MGAPNPYVGACGNLVFGVATWRSECPQLLQKFTRNNETTKGKKDDTNIDVLNCCVESLLLKQNPTLIHLRPAKSFVSRAAQGSNCQKWDCQALPLFTLDKAIPRLFSILILIAGATKNGRAKSIRWSVWQPCFWGCDMTLGMPPAASKVHQKQWNHKREEGWHKHRCAELLRWKLAAQTKPNFDPLASCEELRISSSSRFELSKMGLPSATAFHFGQGHSEAVFNLDFNSRRDQKWARQIHTLERVATLFLGLRHDARNAPSCFKSSPETMKPQKGRRMTQTSMCWTGGAPLWESKFYVPFQPQKRAWNKSNNLICRPELTFIRLKNTSVYTVCI